MLLRSEFRSGLEAFQARNEALVAAQLANLNSTLTESTIELVSGVQADTDRRFAEHAARIQVGEEIARQHSSDIAALQSEMAALRSQVRDQSTSQNAAMAALQRTMEESTTSTQPLQDPAYNAPPNWSILRLNAERVVPVDEVRAMVRMWLDPISDVQAWTLDETQAGSRREVGMDWVLQIAGEASVAAKACRSAVSALQLPNGSWRQLRVGDALVYVSRNRTSKQRRLDMAGKRLLEAISAIHPGITKPKLALVKPVWRAQRQMQAKISYDAVPIAVVTADIQEADVEVAWEPEQMQRLRMDKARILQEFAKRFNSTGVVDTTLWCK